MDGKYFESEGNVKISEDVICTIIGVAVKEADGVSAVAPRSGTGLIPSKKNTQKGIRVELHGGQLVVDLNVNVKFGVKIHEAVSKVQSTVKQTLEAMAGVRVSSVNVFVQGIDMGAGEEKYAFDTELDEGDEGHEEDNAENPEI